MNSDAINTAIIRQIAEVSDAAGVGYTDAFWDAAKVYGINLFDERDARQKDNVPRTIVDSVTSESDPSEDSSPDNDEQAASSTGSESEPPAAEIGY